MAQIKGSVSGVGADVGATSRGLYAELIDSGGRLIGATKTVFVLFATNFTAATTEAMITLTPSRNFVNAATGTSFTITGGKRFVLLGLTVATKNAGAAVQGVLVRVRVNPSGAVVTTSPPVISLGAGTTSATANVVGGGSSPISQGWPCLIELPDTAQIGISQIGTATAGNDVFLWGYEY